MIYDFVVIGSGFGGSISAMRLARKGYRVAILEEGKRWTEETLPRTNWNIRKYLWAPLLGCFGIQAISLLKGVMVLHGKGVGGGSLVYANTLMTPKPEVFTEQTWLSGVDWWKELSPHYQEARRMLGVTQNPRIEIAERTLERVAQKMGVSETFHPTEVGVFFGEPGKDVADPYFQGEGPARTGCIGCGGCMVGCRYNAKNTLPKNYLYFAEKFGAEIFPETRAEKIEPPNPDRQTHTYQITTSRGSFEAHRVILAAGVLGTVKLLFLNRDHYRTLPKLSSTLGRRVRTNGECLLGSTSLDASVDYSKGIAIGAAIHPDPITKIETVKYPSGSSFMRLLAVPLAGPGPAGLRILKSLLNGLTHPLRLLRLLTVWDWARRSVILLVMQSSETQMTLSLKKGLLGPKLDGRADSGEFPSYLQVAQDAVQHYAKETKGVPQNVITEVLLGTPATAHILGGCTMGENAQTGTINARHEVHGYPGLYVCDGSVIAANLGVNPSLTISALAERFASFFPKKEL